MNKYYKVDNPYYGKIFSLTKTNIRSNIIDIKNKKEKAYRFIGIGVPLQ